MATFGRAFGASLAQQGALLNPNWATNPFFSLPDTGLTILAGKTKIIYGNQLTNLAMTNNLVVVYVCDIGTQSGNDFTLSPTSADYGNHSLEITIKNGSKLVDTYTIYFTVERLLTGIGTVKVLLNGDSTCDSGDVPYITAALNTELDSTSIVYLGTQGTTVKTEGRGGWSWVKYLGLEPYNINGVYDVPAYFATNAIDTPDIVYFRLGINDVIYYMGTGLTDANLASIISQSEQVITGFLNFNANLKIVIAFPTTTGVDPYWWNYDFDESIFKQDLFIENIHRLQLALRNKYANGVYNSRVHCSYEAIGINRANAYANGVHFTTTDGDSQLGKGLAPYFNKLMKGSEMIPSNWNVIGTGGWGYSNPAGWLGDGVKLYSNGLSGLFQKTSFLVIAAKYEVDIIVNLTSGVLYAPYAGTPYTISSSGRYVYTMTPTETKLYINSLSFVGEITYLSIKKILF